MALTGSSSPASCLPVGGSPASVKGERDNFDRCFEGFPVVEKFRKIYIRNRENETFLMVLSKHSFETKSFLTQKRTEIAKPVNKALIPLVRVGKFFY